MLSCIFLQVPVWESPWCVAGSWECMNLETIEAIGLQRVNSQREKSLLVGKREGRSKGDRGGDSQPGKSVEKDF